MKHLNLKVNPESLKANPELETAFIKLHGREALNEVYSEDKGHAFTDVEIGEMSEKEFEENREAILKAMGENRILKTH